MSEPELLEAGLQDIVIGLVAPIGTDLDPVCRALASSFARLGYTPYQIQLSQHLDEVKDVFNLDLKHANAEERYHRYMTAVPFVGVAPRRYQDVFRLGDVDRKCFIAFAHEWKPEVAKPRLGEYPSRTEKINMAAEKAAFDEFSKHFERLKNGIHQTGTGLAGSSNAGSSG